MDSKSLIEKCPKFFYINLERCEERKEKLETIFSQYNLKYERVSAIDGNNLEKWDPRLSKFEQACTMSHLKAIQTFYESGEEIGIICEDDITFEFLPYWKTSIDNVIKNAPNDFEILMLSYTVWPHYSNFLENLYNPFILLAHNGCGSYLINRKGASKILKEHTWNNPKLEKYTKIRPVADVIIYDLVKTYVYRYSLFTYPDNNDSTIQNIIPGKTDNFCVQSKLLAKKIYGIL